MEIGECGAETFSEFIIIGGLTTSVANRVVLTSPPANRHDGTKTGNTHTIVEDNTGGTWGIMNPQQDHCDVSFLHLRPEGGAASTSGLRPLFTGDADQDHEGLLIEGCTAGGFQGFNADNDSVRVSNSVHYGTDGTNEAGFTANGAFYDFRYCVSIRQEVDDASGKTGFRYVKCRNCASFHWGPTGGHADYLNLRAGSSNNASSDASGDSGLR